MKNASEISKAVAERNETASVDRRRAVAKRRHERHEQYRLLAPPDVRHRRREARRWIDEMVVRTGNPPLSERRPDERLFESVGERWLVREALFKALEHGDPELFAAVDRLQFEDRTRDYGITLEEWKSRSVCRSERRSRVRAEMRDAGLI